MIKKYFIMALIFLAIIITLISAQDHTVIKPYDFTNDTSYKIIVEHSSILLKITTEKDAICRYSNTQGRSYASMEGRFDLSADNLHEKSLTELGDGGIYKYYIKCVEDPDSYTEPAEMEIILRVSSLVSAQIILSEDSPLKEGIVDVRLLTSKLVSQTPVLTYSFDGIVYDDLPLFGSEKVWEGHLVVPKNFGEGVLSFKFRANDLEGRQGDEITSGGSWVVDTVKPKMISNIEATGYEGKIKLEWHVDEELEEYNVYRSVSPNPDYTDFYTTTDDSPYSDTGVEKGKTYYYKITGIDEAGNEGPLSKEIYATALLNDNTETSGLSIELRGYVDNQITEIDLVADEIDDIKKSINLKEDKEKNLFSDLQLEKEIDGAKTELQALKRDTEKYKLQSLTKQELDKKLDAVELKLNIVKRKVPENLIILEDDSRNEEVNEEDIEETILEIKPEITDREKEKSIKETLKIIEGEELEIKSNFFVVEIVYLDGSKKEISVIKRVIKTQLEKNETSFFYEIIPKDLAETASEIDIETEHRVIKEDPILSFNSDVEKIIYTINKRINFDVLKEAKIVFLYLYDEEEKETTDGITGYFSFGDLGRTGYVGIIIGIIIIVALAVYFLYLRKNKPSELFLKIQKNTEKALDFLKKENLKKAKKIYESLKIYYRGLDKKEKKKVYKQIDFLKNKILVFDLEKGLQKLEKEKDKMLFLRLEKIYNKLSGDFRKQISYFFEKVKNDLENEDSSSKE
jgi:hypothetical protein